MKEFLKNMILFAVSFFVIFIIAEIGFRVYINYATIYDMEMHKYAKKLKRSSATPGLSHEHIPNSKARLMNVDVKINNMGFRGDFLENEKRPNEYRILVVGSSITMGWGVPYNSVFTALLQADLNKSGGKYYNVINSGIGNYNSVLEAAYLKKIAPVVKPDMVILHYFLRDAEYISPAKANWLIKNSYLAAYLYVKIQETLSLKSSKYSSIGEYYYTMYDKPDNKGWADAQKAICDMKGYCKSLNIPFMVLMQPDVHDFSANSYQKKCHSIIRAFLEKEDIKYLDLFDPFKNKIGDNPQSVWVSKDDPHPNAYGHHIIYEALDEYLKKKL